jgi:hypothetical protein
MTKHLPAPKGTATVLPFSREEYERKYPAHTCVDRPEVPCEACVKWTKKKKRVSGKRA